MRTSFETVAMLVIVTVLAVGFGRWVADGVAASLQHSTALIEQVAR